MTKKKYLTKSEYARIHDITCHDVNDLIEIGLLKTRNFKRAPIYKNGEMVEVKSKVLIVNK